MVNEEPKVADFGRYSIDETSKLLAKVQPSTVAYLRSKILLSIVGVWFRKMSPLGVRLYRCRGRRGLWGRALSPIQL